MQANWKPIKSEKHQPEKYVRYLVCGVSKEFRTEVCIIRPAEPFTDCAHFDGKYWKSASHAEYQWYEPGEVQYWDEMPKPHKECHV